MAVFEVEAGDVGTSFFAATGAFQGNGSAPVGTISDENNSDNMFSTSEVLLANFPSQTIVDARTTYLGQVTVDGATYPVFNFLGTNLVFGLDRDDIPFFNDLGPLDTSDLTVAFCFGPGTMISTPDGATAIEDLEIGAQVLTQNGESVPVKWIGRQTLQSCLMGPRAQPVCIRAGAIGPNIPDKDLIVTGDHGMVVDGYVINAAALVNGSSIDWMRSGTLGHRFTVYHVETQNHDVILANGAPAETFVDARTRCHFDNHKDYLARYGAERIIPDMTLPRISAQRLVPEHIRTRLNIPRTARAV